VYTVNIINIIILLKSLFGRIIWSVHKVSLHACGLCYLYDYDVYIFFCFVGKINFNSIQLLLKAYILYWLSVGVV